MAFIEPPLRVRSCIRNALSSQLSHQFISKATNCFFLIFDMNFLCLNLGGKGSIKVQKRGFCLFNFLLRVNQNESFFVLILIVCLEKVQTKKKNYLPYCLGVLRQTKICLNLWKLSSQAQWLSDGLNGIQKSFQEYDESFWLFLLMIPALCL